MEEDTGGLTPDEQEAARKTEGQIKALINERTDRDGESVWEDEKGHRIIVKRHADPNDIHPEFEIYRNIILPAEHGSGIVSQSFKFFPGHTKLSSTFSPHNTQTGLDEDHRSGIAKPDELEDLRGAMIASKEIRFK